MYYTEYQPAAALEGEIDVYWVLDASVAYRPSGRRIYADGCSDIICNAGQGNARFYPLEGKSNEIVLEPGDLYLGGTMTAYGVLITDPGCLLTGIRFRPGGFYAHFPQSMEPAVDATLKFEDQGLCSLMRTAEDLCPKLDHWLTGRQIRKSAGNTKYDFEQLRQRMIDSVGRVAVEALADEMCVSQKTLERIFKRNVGIPPKGFLRIIRFRALLKLIRESPAKDFSNLLQMAADLGYHDHAHLTHEFRKYAGLTPSELADFCKTGIDGGQYF